SISDRVVASFVRRGPPPGHNPGHQPSGENVGRRFEPVSPARLRREHLVDGGRTLLIGCREALLYPLDEVGLRLPDDAFVRISAREGLAEIRSEGRGGGEKGWFW